MEKDYQGQNDEQRKLIDNKQPSSNDDDEKSHRSSSSRLEWAESSWTRWLQVLCWCWITPTLSIASKTILTENDLDGLPHEDKSSVLLNRLQSSDWISSSTWKLVIREFWKEYVVISLYCFPYLFSRVVQPLLLREVVTSAINKDSSPSSIYVPVIFLCLFGITQALFDHQIYFIAWRTATRIRNALMSVIYKHSLSMSTAMWQHTNTGQIMNLIASDTSKFEEMYSLLHILLGGPAEAVTIFVLLCWIIGSIPTLVTYVVFFLSLVILFLVNRHFSKYHEQKVSCSDKRVQAFSEFIHGCQIIKMYNWEQAMEDRIRHMRQDELNTLRRAYIIRNLHAIYSFILVPFLALTTFGTAWLLDYPMNAVDCFTTLSFLGLLRGQAMFAVPIITERFTNVQVAGKRIDAFMRLTTTQDHHASSSSQVLSSLDYSQKGQISISNASFSWSDNHRCLASLNISITQGTFVGIAGAVGSGKSSLLAAILGEMNLINGQLNTHYSSFAYASQLPWIFADTIRNNILLNRPFDQQRYRDVIYACCLDVDLSLFGVSGDLTMIGEKGVNLSGGQKARVSLARAMYDDDADIYLIDDPLAAVDINVAEQIYRRCFSSQGLLKNKTRLLVTHQTQFLIEADQIIFLSQGHIDEQRRLGESIITKNLTDKSKPSQLDSLINEDTSPSDDTQSIINKETVVNGNVHWNVYFRLFTASPLGILAFCFLIILLVLGEVFYDGTNYWLSIWLKKSHSDQQRLSSFASIYFGLTIATILADIVRTMLFFSIVLHGTNRLHNNMLRGLLYTSVQFFESNSSGRILSRASNDQKVMDELLPPMLLLAVKSSLMFLGSIVIICLIKPYVLIVIAVMIPFVVFLCRFYLKSKIQLKQLESITRSPVYDLLSSSLDGLVSIRAFGVKDHFIQLFTDRIDRNTRAFINMQGAARWFDMRLNLLPIINTFATAMLLVIFQDSADRSLIALGLMYAISLPKSFQLSILSLFQADFLMTSAERIDEYAQLQPEEDQGAHQRLINTSPQWPTHGSIQFTNYSLRHRSGLESVLKNINLQIKPSEKIGIIGRTGAGKSSLFKGIFRFIQRSNIDGQILIDDVDISRITLHHLRSHLSIIPQQPILFSGTLRYNLDPFNLYSDQQCWMALDDVQLKQFVSDHSSGLDMSISESGHNLSVGQCQLICIARAILKNGQILLIDEATSNVDQTTDEIIQTIIANKFQDRTVLTIAHRLNTVARSDRIVVIDKGIIVNCDTPMNILPQYQQSSQIL